ncbi:MAG: ATP-binding protein [Chromatiales bacterium]|nr:ATP-binding protein [Chromatiales bacterium]MDX9767899.1 ATP-binding protein [Ectothiorhodospiraceae bacterium]
MSRKRFPLGLIVMGSVFLLLLVSLYLMGDAVQHSERFGQFYIWLLAFNSLALLALAGLILVNLAQVLRQALRREPGSRLTLKLVLVFALLALAPVSVVYYFSTKFLGEGIDSWFDVRVEKALEDALELSRSSFDHHLRQRLREAIAMARQLEGVNDLLASFTLEDLRADGAAVELSLFGANNRIIASSSSDTGQVLPRLLTEEILLRLQQGQPYTSVEPMYGNLHIRTVVPVAERGSNRSGTRYLQAVFPVDARLSHLADNVQDAFAAYKEFAFLRQPLKQSFTITLSLVLLLSVMSAMWAAFFSARRLVAPVRELAEGTRAVAAGEYHKRLPVHQNDELGFLVRSFNDMTATLAATRDEVERSRQLAEVQRAYLEAVLQNLSSGVLTLDRGLELHTANTAANEILELDLGRRVGQALDEIGHESPLVARLLETLGPQLERCETGWQTEITVFGAAGRKVLMCRGVWLPRLSGMRAGHVIVIDDITTLIQAQRNAAWGEVARRLAHEIKNPLTPIQLSAERLGRKLLPQLDEAHADILRRGAHTIIQQVEAMKNMVNAFGDYARAPAMAPRPTNLNDLVRDVVELYRDGATGTQIVLEFDTGLPLLDLDTDRMRQLLHNLIKNGLEALGGTPQSRLTITTRCMREGHCDMVELRIEDNGPGFDQTVAGQMFEPYVTNKPKGTGLGLAIVKKIVEEHGGMVSADNGKTGGACITVRLPVTTREPATLRHEEAM